MTLEPAPPIDETAIESIHRVYRERIATLEAENARLNEMVKSPWDDKPLPEDDAINAQHPMRSDDPARHDRYAEAMRLVGARRGKYALVDLVNWLLARADKQHEDKLGERAMRMMGEAAEAELRARITALVAERDRLQTLIADLSGALVDEGPDWSNDGVFNLRTHVAAALPTDKRPDWLLKYLPWDHPDNNTVARIKP